jgi:recombination protein RecR
LIGIAETDGIVYMPVHYAKPLARLVGEFEKLPGVGPKSAQRLAYYVLRISDDEARNLASAITDVKEHIRFCTICGNYSEGDICDICQDSRRSDTLLCVVAEPRDLIAMEKTGEYRGRFHVLHGVISPMDGIGPDKLRVKELESRLANGHFEEVILATNPTVEGNTTALYLTQSVIRPLN